MKRYGFIEAVILALALLIFTTVTANVNAEPADSTLLTGTLAPLIDDQFGFATLCDLGEPRYFQVVASDPENDPLTYVKISGPGSIDAQTGLLTYVPDTSGVFVFQIAVYDLSLADTAFVFDTLVLNSPPQVMCRDTIVYLCNPAEICFDVNAVDVDGDSIEIYMLEGIGSFTMLTESSGQTCFMPADIDSATYQFVFRAADSCKLAKEESSLETVPLCCQDTAHVTVVINQPPQLTCPGPQNLFLCQGGQFCYDISAFDPEGETLTYNILSNNVTLVGQTICLAVYESSQFDVIVEAVDECGGADTCVIPVTVTINSAPAVTTADDFAITLCESENVCFEASVSDIDGNLDGIGLAFGSYDDVNKTLCFVPDTSGVYTFTLTAIDSCGASATSVTNVTVTLNQTPMVTIAEGLAFDLCYGQQACVPVTVEDDNIISIVSGLGIYDYETGNVCFEPDSPGVYVFAVTATDSCGVEVSTTGSVTVSLKPPVSVHLGDDIQSFLCAPEPICIPVMVSPAYATLTTNLGTYDAELGQVCFTPKVSGTYSLAVQAVDSCGFAAVDTAVINVAFNSYPVISNFNDKEIYLCYPEPICLPVDVVDPDDNLVSVTVNRGTYADGQVCFTPYDSGSYPIIVTAKDACGLTTVDTAVLKVSTDQSVNIIVPNDTSFFTCELDTFCFPIYGIPENAQVSVSGINTWFNSETQSICYYAECASANKITLSVKTACTTFVKKFTVTVMCNTEPLVILPPDTLISLCEPAQICLPVGVNDQDGNLTDVTVEGGVYDAITGKVCFTAETSGQYPITVTATDSCGAADSDVMLVTVDINTPPVCSVPADTTIYLCNPGQILLPVTAADVNGNLVECALVDGPGLLADGNWIYNVINDESVSVTIRCTDACGAACETSFAVTFIVNEAPTCTVPEDQTISQCELSEIRLPVLVSDPDNDTVSCQVIDGPGQIIDGYWVYTPAGTETVDVTVRCEDGCGLYCEGSFSVSFVMNEAPVCQLPADTTVFVCWPEETIQLPVSYTDDKDSATCIVIDGPGEIVDGYWTFAPVQGSDVSVTIRCTDECGATCEGTFNVTFIVNEAPTCEVPADTTILLCGPATIELPLGAVDFNQNLANCTVIEGPGQIINGVWTYEATVSESFTVGIRCEDSCGAACENSFQVAIAMNHLPVVEAQSNGLFLCAAGELRTLSVMAQDSDGDILTYSLISGPGTIDPASGVISYYPETAGTYQFEVAVADRCGSVTAVISDEISINGAPVSFGYDSTVNLCGAGQICFDINVTDPDGDVLNIVQIEGLGEFNITGLNSGRTCFTPDNVPGATYTFVYTAADPCGAFVTDTIRMTVLINRAPELSCPGAQEFFICDEETFCFDVEATDPEGDAIELNILSENATIEGHSICLTATASGEYNVIIEAVDECGGSDTCVVPVTVVTNSSPYITMAADFAIALCGPETVCLNASADDPDFNLASVTVNFGTYDVGTRRICLDVDTAGTYMITMTATDSCGISVTDTTHVTVTLNDAPVVDLGDDFSVSLCQVADICFAASVNDDNIELVSSNRGFYSQYTGQFCFTPDTSGIYQLILWVTDACGVMTSDTVNVTVNINKGPFVELGDDQTMTLCKVAEVCLDVNTIANYASIVTSEGTYYNPNTGQLCFTPDISDTYVLSMTVTDSCGLAATDEVRVSVTINSAPQMSHMPDTTVYLCFPTSVCLPLTVTDIDDNIVSLTVNRGSYSDGLVCFTPYDSGSYRIIATAVDECGAKTADTAVVRVVTDQQVQLTVPKDTTIFMCELDTLCFAISGVPDNGVVSVSGINTWYNQQSSTVCFYAECATANKITVTVKTPCGTYSKSFTVTVKCNSEPLVILPPDSSITICEPTQVCVPVGVTDIDRNLTSVTATGGTYSAITSRVCFTADTSGVYTIRVTAVDACQASDVDEMKVTVHLNTAPYVIYNEIDSIFLTCAGGEICVPVQVGDPDLNLSSVAVSMGEFDSQTGRLCFAPDTTGLYTIMVTATDACGAVTTSPVHVSVKMNSAPTVVARDTTMTVCVPVTVCFNFTASDVDGNLVKVTSSQGVVEGNTVCFLPPSLGTHKVVLTAQDACGALGYDTVTVTLNSGPTAAIICAQDKSFTLCGPDTVKILAPVTPVTATVTIYDNGAPATGYYNMSTGNVVLYVSSAGLHSIRMIAASTCGGDTCDFNVQVAITEPASVSCPGRIDTILCLAQPTTLCYPVTVAGTGVTVTVNSGASYNAGQVCLPVSQPGSYSVRIIAANNCGADTCTTVINVTANPAPTVSLPEDLMFERCLDDTDMVCIDGIFAADANGIVSFNQVCGAGAFTKVTADSGKICFLPDHFGRYEFCFTASDGCLSTTDTFFVDINEKEDCDVCVRVSIDGGDCVPIGVSKDVYVNIETNDRIGGFDLLIHYDASVSSFTTATITSTAIQGWEYFTYKLITINCTSTCPSGLVRLFGIADINNGLLHPPDSTLSPDGRLVKMSFGIINDQNVAGQFLPVGFYWTDCGDNTFSDPTGTLIYIDNRIYNAEGILVWDEMNDITYPESSRPFGIGTPDTCIEASVVDLFPRCVEYIGGGICIMDHGTSNDRGDLNLNSVPYEIGDAVLYSNYFIYGLGVFTVDMYRQIAASDVNADGLTLSVADLVLLIRIILNDAEPIPSLTVRDDAVILSTKQLTDRFVVETQAAGDISGALLVYDLNDGIQISEPKLADAASEMTLGWNIVNNQLRLLIYDFDGSRVEPGTNVLIEIPYSGEGSLTLASSEFVDYYGQPYKVETGESQLPTGFSLSQNYPNPFNPSTTIEFGLPVACKWNLTVFNINGGLVRQFEGAGEAGTVTVDWDGTSASGGEVASGVYFYKLEAGSFNATKKMILIK